MPERNWEKDWEICKKATPGPWYAIPHPEYKNASWRVDTSPDVPWASFGQLAYMSEEDARFVAEAREALPYYLQRVQELEAQCAIMRKHVKEAIDFLNYGDLAIAKECLNDALSDNVGRTLQEKIEKLEAVVEAVKSFREQCNRYITCRNLKNCTAECLFVRACKALETLEKEE